MKPVFYMVFLLAALSIAGGSVSFAEQASNSNLRVATVLPAPIRAEIASKSDIQFRRLSLSQGLSQTRVGQILQDDDGYMWLGSQHGVNRYDGYSFQVFKHDRDDPNSLSGTYIYSMFKDHSGTIWIGSDQFLDAFDRKTGKFRHVVLDPSTPTVLNISQDKAGYLWLSTSQGLFRLQPDSGEVRKFGHIDGDADSLSTNDVKSTGEDRHGVFWVATANGLEAFDPSTNKVSLRIPLHVEAREFRFYEDTHGLFWIYYGSGSGIALYDRASNTLRELSFNNAAEDILSGVYNIIEARNGDMWFATMGAGLLRLNRSTFAFDQYVNDPTDAQSLSEDRAIEVFEDRQGNIWTGLHSSPPNVFIPEALPFRKIWPYPGHINKLGEPFVNAVLEDRGGNVWLGTGGALNRIDKDGSLKTIDLSGNGKSVEILSIVQDQAGTLWIGTIGAGLYSLNPRTGETSSYRYEKGRPDWITSDVVTRIYVEPSGVLWLSTWNGLDRFDPVARRFKAYRADGSENRAFFSIVPDDLGNLWIGSLVGLVKFEKSSGTFTEFRHDPDNPASLSNNTVNNIFRDRAGTLWLATHNGLDRFHPDTGRFDAFFDKDGLAGSAISCIQQDRQGFLWMSTNHGVTRMDTATDNFENFTSIDGLPGDDMGGWHACSAGSDGKLYFGGFPGTAVTNPSYTAGSAYEDALAFTAVKIGEQPTIYPLGAINQAYRLDHDQGMTVTFSAFDFSNPGSVRYRYKLVGLDADWHYLPKQSRTITFAALPPGSFGLEVQAAAERGMWSRKSAEILIRVDAPWWQTWWFYVTSGLMVCMAAYAFYRIRVMQIAAIYNMRLEERLGERTRVARDLHDTLLQSFQGLTYRLEAVRNMLPTEPLKAAELLDVVLLKSDDAIIEGRETIQSLRDPTMVTGDLITAVKSDGEALAATQSSEPAAEFSLKVDGRIEKFPTDIRNELRQICREALRNAFAHSHATKIECGFMFDAASLTMTVRDNGKGIVEGAKASRSSGHFGIPGITERAAHIDAVVTITSVMGSGTVVELRITTNPAKLTAIAARLGSVETDWR